MTQLVQVTLAWVGVEMYLVLALVLWAIVVVMVDKEFDACLLAENMAGVRASRFEP